MGGCVYRWLKIALHHLPIEVHYHQIARGEFLIGDPAGLDHY
jgi:hypothetical protein